jgi:hypothetical protein
LKSGAFCVFSKYKMMDEAQKLSNPKWNIQSSEAYRSVLNCTVYSPLVFLFILYWTLVIQIWNIIQHVVFMSFTSVACFVGLFYSVMFSVLVSLL